MDFDDVKQPVNGVYSNSLMGGHPPPYFQPSGVSTVSNKHVFYGDVEVGRISANELILNGDSVDERLRRIEILLKIPTRNIELEQKYAKLAELWHEYHDLLYSLEIIEALKGKP